MELLLDTRDRGAVRATSRSVGGQLDMTFDVRAEYLCTVRDIVQAHLHWWGIDSGTTDRMLTVINELLTNVMQHTLAGDDGCRMASLLLQRVPDGVTAIVRDQDTRPPTHVTPDPLDESGRGLLLIRALTDDTSVSMTPDGKDVWVFIGDPVAPEHF